MTTKRERIISKYNGICQICGKKTKTEILDDWRDFPELDHIIPKKHGGSNKESNLSLLCNECNSKKRAMCGKETISKLLEKHRLSISSFDLNLLKYEFNNKTISENDLLQLENEIADYNQMLIGHITNLLRSVKGGSKTNDRS